MSDNSTTPDIQDVAPGSFPLYTNDPASAPTDNPNPPNSSGDTTPSMISLVSIPQGAGSGLNSDMVDGVHAALAVTAGPNILVATDNYGRLPFSTMQVPLQSYIQHDLGGF